MWDDDNDKTNFLRRLDEWFARSLFDVHGQPQQQRGGILMGCPIWGEEYIRRFEDWCVASILALENADALRGSRIVLFCNDLDVGRLASVAKRRLEGVGIEVLLQRIPPEIVSGLAHVSNGRYWLMGTVNNITVQMAARAGMGFHFLAPDHAYSERFWPAVKRLAQQHHAIVQCSISANTATAEADLERFRRPDGTVVAPSAELCSVAWRHLHPQMRGMLVTKDHDIEARIPASTWLAWQGRETLTIQTPHQHPVYMSPHLCRHAPSRVPHTMDCELPVFMPFGFYTATPADDMAYIELSSPDKPSRSETMTGAQWTAHLWEVMKFRDAYLPFLSAACEVPIGRHKGAMVTREIERQRAGLLERVAAAKLPLLEELAQRIIND